jgi:hypothetical protein
MRIHRNALAALAAALLSVFSGGTSYASTLQFGVVGSPIDLSANVSEAILPGGTVFQNSNPLFGTAPNPVQSAELLHLSDTGVNASGRSTNISDAFASSLAESNGNGGVGVSQTIFGSPDGPLFDSFVCNFVSACKIDSVSTDVRLGVLHKGDTLAYVYTLTAEGTTHGFEHGYDAFLGDPFGAQIVADNLSVSVTLADSAAAPEAGTCALMLLGLTGLLVWRRHNGSRFGL